MMADYYVECEALARWAQRQSDKDPQGVASSHHTDSQAGLKGLVAVAI